MISAGLRGLCAAACNSMGSQMPWRGEQNLLSMSPFETGPGALWRTTIRGAIPQWKDWKITSALFKREPIAMLDLQSA